jgi:hypothetical protein
VGFEPGAGLQQPVLLTTELPSDPTELSRTLWTYAARYRAWPHPAGLSELFHTLSKLRRTLSELHRTLLS